MRVLFVILLIYERLFDCSYGWNEVRIDSGGKDVSVPFDVRDHDGCYQ